MSKARLFAGGKELSPPQGWLVKLVHAFTGVPAPEASILAEYIAELEGENAGLKQARDETIRECQRVLRKQAHGFTSSELARQLQLCADAMSEMVWRGEGKTHGSVSWEVRGEVAVPCIGLPRFVDAPEMDSAMGAALRGSVKIGTKGTIRCTFTPDEEPDDG